MRGDSLIRLKRNGAVMDTATRTIPFIERRRHPRRKAGGWASAITGHWSHQPVLANIELLDLSEGGLAARTRCHLPEGEEVTVMLPADRDAALPARSVIGHVIRSQAAGELSRIAVRFDEPQTVAG
jgi:hypothetical protein